MGILNEFEMNGIAKDNKQNEKLTKEDMKLAKFRWMINEITRKLGIFSLSTDTINPLEIIFDKEECNPYSKIVIDGSIEKSKLYDIYIVGMQVNSISSKGIDGIENLIADIKINKGRDKYMVIFWCLFVIAVDEHMYNEKINIIADLAYIFKIEEDELRNMVNRVKEVLKDIKSLENSSFVTKGGITIF